jgi:SAM-dependent methyltransferase
MMGTVDQERLTLFYDRYGEIEDELHAALDESLEPRGPDLLYELVAGFELPAGSVALDVGCGDGRHSLRLAERLGFEVVGVDPAPGQVELARDRVPRGRFVQGRAEALPVDDASVDLVWCRDVLLHVADLARVYAEFARVLRPGGRALVYQMFAGRRLEPREADELWRATGAVPASTEPARTDDAIAAAGLRVDERIDLSTEWGEWEQERSGKPGRRLLWAARLLRDPERYVARFGQANYEVMLGDCLWHVYAMIGKLDRRAYILSKA